MGREASWLRTLYSSGRISNLSHDLYSQKRIQDKGPGWNLKSDISATNLFSVNRRDLYFKIYERNKRNWGIVEEQSTVPDCFVAECFTPYSVRLQLEIGTVFPQLQHAFETFPYFTLESCWGQLCWSWLHKFCFSIRYLSICISILNPQFQNMKCTVFKSKSFPLDT